MTLSLYGARFGMLVAAEIVGQSQHGHLWRCRCDCGRTVDVRASSLKSGNTKSCGCLKPKNCVERTREPLIRFIESFDKSPSGCWLWRSVGKVRRYPSFYIGRRREQAHRASWRLFKGAIPDGMHVLHRCDVPACVNPNHLFLGTHQDNMDDMHAKGRAWLGGAKKRTGVSV